MKKIKVCGGFIRSGTSWTFKFIFSTISNQKFWYHNFYLKTSSYKSHIKDWLIHTSAFPLDILMYPVQYNSTDSVHNAVPFGVCDECLFVPETDNQLFQVSTYEHAMLCSAVCVVVVELLYLSLLCQSRITTALNFRSRYNSRLSPNKLSHQWNRMLTARCSRWIKYYSVA